MSEGWVSLHRKILENPHFDDPLLMALWVRLLLMASHKDGEKTKTGECVFRITSLARIFKCPRTTLRDKVKKLEKLRSISVLSTSYHMHVKVLNFQDYQNLNATSPTDPAATTLQINRNKNKNKKKESNTESTREASLPSPLPSLGEIWNEFCGALPKVRRPERLSAGRQKLAASRWRENPNREYWIAVVQKIAASSFCRGVNDRGWKADFDFLLRPDTAEKTLEGKYDDRKSNDEIEKLRRRMA